MTLITAFITITAIKIAFAVACCYLVNMAAREFGLWD